MKDIKVSVVIPIYNAETYIKECLDSILLQTLKDIEIICVDDGSTDNSIEILNKYVKKDNRIILLKQSNKYAGVARNLGIQYAVGKYLCFLDADDFFSPIFLEKMYLAANENMSDVVICNSNNYDSNTGKITKGFMRQEFLPPNKDDFSRENIPEKLFQITDGWPWNKLFLREFVKQNELRFSETRTANDGYFVFMALAKAKRITKIDDYLVNWRINNQNSLSNTRNISWYCGFQMLYDIKQGLIKSNLYNILEKTFLNFSLEYLIWSLERMTSYTAKEKIFYCMQQECKEKLKITDFPADYYYYKNLYKECQYIETHSFPEYLSEMLNQKSRELEKCWRYNQDLSVKLQKKIWPFPYRNVKPNSSIILYGAGKVGQDYYRQISESHYCKVVLWMDKKFESQKGNLDIHGWRDRLDSIEFDQVIIALLNKAESEIVTEMLKSWGISEEKIFWFPIDVA